MKFSAENEIPAKGWGKTGHDESVTARSDAVKLGEKSEVYELH